MISSSPQTLTSWGPIRETRNRYNGNATDSRGQSLCSGND